MDHSILDQRLSDLPASVWQKIARIDELKGQWIGGMEAGRIPRPTINQAINRLIDLKKIERLGIGRGTRYRRYNN